MSAVVTKFTQVIGRERQMPDRRSVAAVVMPIRRHKVSAVILDIETLALGNTEAFEAIAGVLDSICRPR